MKYRRGIVAHLKPHIKVYYSNMGSSDNDCQHYAAEVYYLVVATQLFT